MRIFRPWKDISSIVSLRICTGNRIIECKSTSFESEDISIESNNNDNNDNIDNIDNDDDNNDNKDNNNDNDKDINDINDINDDNDNVKW